MQSLAEMIGCSRIHLQNVKAGRKELSPKLLVKLTEALGCTIADLLDKPQTVNVVGMVGAGAEVYPIDDHANGGGLEKTDHPNFIAPTYATSTPNKLVAVQVKGESMLPAYKEGDLIFYNRTHDWDDILLHKECVIMLEDERCFVKTIEKGDNEGRYTLMSHNAAPIRNVAIKWAAKVLWTKKG